MTESDYKERWHLSKAVPVSIIFFLAIQTVGVIIWATKLDGRVSTLENTSVIQRNRIDMLDSMHDKLILIEERQNNVLKTLAENAIKLDQLVSALPKSADKH